MPGFRFQSLEIDMVFPRPSCLPFDIFNSNEKLYHSPRTELSIPPKLLQAYHEVSLSREEQRPQKTEGAREKILGELGDRDAGKSKEVTGEHLRGLREIF